MQDLSEAHCKNILRTILRNQKKAEAEMEQGLAELLATLSGSLEGDDVEIKTVTMDQDQIDQEIDSLFPADVRRGPTIH